MKIRIMKILLFSLTIALMMTSCGNDSDTVISVQKESLIKEPEGKVLIAMGDYDYPPFEYNDEYGKPAGFNIDILRAVLSVMNIRVVITLAPWSEVREKLEQGRIDILAGMFKTPEREKRVDFTIPHFISTYVIFTREDSEIENISKLLSNSNYYLLIWHKLLEFNIY